ncbi:putative f-box domain-containing protein [Phaeoacremonium minimum UCRPA7]|uniref:Putative f-box domain-containing protein n=1 Tax=Phaeoacremonium minimum (strain UCR-PA7) TaxID=1286976 RepID=R8BSK0_PHAM7|nr:putative f-box domain-containing protein [Phaeoacremonium minimum UCRPA7]EOO02348.1 putative f-box domain-containing protein [Phaeoacremonium minimum UCRPA7]
MAETPQPNHAGGLDSSGTQPAQHPGDGDIAAKRNMPKLKYASDEGLRSYSDRHYISAGDDAIANGYPRCDHDCATGSTSTHAHARDGCHLPALPSELIDNILSYLSPLDLLSLSLTCHVLHAHATDDHLWHALVQSHIPGMAITTPYPCATFRELYSAHDPRWFLPRYKLWFCDRDLTGKLIIVRYDQRRGCIEGYQLLATSNRTTHQQWGADSEVIIHAFEPEVKLHLDKPVLQLRAHSLENLIRAKKATTPVFSFAGPSRFSSSSSLQINRFTAEIPMPLDDRPTDTMFSNFMLARPLAKNLVDERQGLPFPYGNVWPPPAIPARHRVAAASLYQREGGELLASDDRPTGRAEMSDQTFRIRSWMEMRPAGMRGVSFGWVGPTLLDRQNGDEDEVLEGTHIGEEITTFSTLDPVLYTPTADMPWRGIWVGDYSGHGCEFLLINQEHSDDDVNAGAMEREESETEEEFEKRKADARIYRGRLEAVKLTGDPNVPRGEYTFVADDLGSSGFVAIVQDEPFRGARVVRSRGHVAGTGFLNDTYIESQLLLISPNRLAQYWVGFGHISFFERVDVDSFLIP